MGYLVDKQSDTGVDFSRYYNLPILISSNAHGDHGDIHVQTVQELQESICVNKEGIQEDINSEMEDQKLKMTQ
jgi:hypothetical protein